VLRPQFTDQVIVPHADDPILGGDRCAVAGCDRLGQGCGLCGSHYSRWRKSGRPDVAEFISTTGPLAARSGLRPTQCYDLRRLPGGLRLEVAYALQCRLDERRARLRPGQVARAVKVLAASGASSLLHRSLQYWLAKAGQRRSRPGAVRHTDAGAFLRYAYQRVDDLARGISLDDEYDRDTWDARRLGLPATGSSYLVRFGGMTQPWLRAVTKRWCRHRLGSGKAIGTVAGDALAMTWFARFLAEICPNASNESVITRELLEAYLARLATADLAAQTRLGYLVDLRSFLEACRRYRWLPRLPDGAALHPDDMPPRGQYLPRFIPGTVMAQLEREDNLARIADLTTRHLVIVLIETGLRASDACRLPVDGLVDDSAGWPCLRYFNSKVKTEQLIPLSATAANAIKAQQQHLRIRWPAGTRWLFPRVQSNPDGALPFSYATLHHRLNQWQDDIDLRDEAGEPVRVNAHRFRHTLGTRLINSGVPEHVVQKLLGHKSPQMTSRYASLHDTTMRAEFDRYCEQRVNIAGELIPYNPQSPAADAEWAKHNLARLRDSLPNGFCGRPPQQDCPHPNACLTCPDFQTTPESLPTHRAQRERTAVLIATADQLGRTRQAANHRRVAANLDRIISALEAMPSPTEEHGRDAG
jgi:integrase